MSGISGTPTLGNLSGNNSSGSRSRRDNPAYKDPDVAKTIGKLKEKLRNAERRTGDMNKEIYEFCTLPYFQTIKGNPVITQLYSGGKTNQRGFTYPHPAYGWFQQIFNHYLVNWTISSYANSMPFKIDRTIDNYRRKYGIALRRWWVAHRNDAIDQINEALNKYAINFITNTPVLTTAVNLAISFKQRAGPGQTINSFNPTGVAQIKQMLNQFGGNNFNTQSSNVNSSPSSSSSSSSSSDDLTNDIRVV